MKVVQVVCVYPPYKGGIGRVAENYFNYSKEFGCDARVVTPNYFKTNENNHEIIRLDTFLKYGNGAFLPQLFFYLDKFDIIHFHYPFFGAVETSWLFKLFNKKKNKLIIHYHMDILKLDGVARLLSLPTFMIRNSFLKIADKITCASLDYVQNSQIRDFYKKNIEKFIEIPFSVDTEKFCPKERDNNVINFLFVGGLDKAHSFKGLDVLLKAVGRIIDGNYHLNIVGEGSLKSDFVALCSKLGLTKKVTFLGSVDESGLTDVYKKSDVFILPSVNSHEAFGIVLLEAMSSGLPLIASNLPGVRKVFKDGEHGFLTEPGNDIGLSQKIEKFLHNKSLVKNMGELARRYALEKYRRELEKNKLKEIYEDLFDK